MKKTILAAFLFLMSVNLKAEEAKCELQKEKSVCEIQRARAAAKKAIKVAPRRSVAPAASTISNDQQMMNSPIIIINGESEYRREEKEPRVRVRTVVKTVIKKERVLVRQKRRKNALIIMGGIGLTGAHSDVNNQDVHTTTEHGPVVGVQYLRSFSERGLVGATIMSNTTATLNLGVEF